MKDWNIKRVQHNEREIKIEKKKNCLKDRRKQKKKKLIYAALVHISSDTLVDIVTEFPFFFIFYFLVFLPKSYSSIG